MKKLSFTYDPLNLVRHCLSMYLDALNEDQPETRAVRYSRSDYFSLHLTTEKMEELLNRYVVEEKIEVITLKDWKKDCSYIWEYIHEDKDFQELVLKYNRRGLGATGFGVYDIEKNKFYDCHLGDHWRTICNIIDEDYNHLLEAFLVLTVNLKLEEHEGIKREVIEKLIMENFELIGGTKSLDQYIT